MPKIKNRINLPAPVPALVELYRVAEPGSDRLNYIGLDRNERLQPFPDWFMATLWQSLEASLLTNYPLQDRLVEQLSTTLGLSKEQVLLTAGSDAAVKALYQAYLNPGDRVIMLEPSYAMYPVYAQMFQAEPVLIPFDHNLKFDQNKLLDSLDSNASLVMLANPNQPTGTLLAEEVFRELLERAAEAGTLVAVDEAYYPFSHFTAVPWLDRYPNLVVLRTFSKAAGLAGLRIGYTAGHPQVIANLFKVRTANDINSMAILCASQILAHPEIIDDYVAAVESGKQLLEERALALGLTPLPTHTNFMLIRVSQPHQPAELVERLRQLGYLVKGPFKTSGLEDCIRVTLGPPEVMAAFADALGQAFG